ncbi:MAG TPA: histidine kinase dimerization/phosphoacceptor domain -containing protein [Bacteroidia bacterium]|nr:histidine kinase dimerization/phosphoacceptor domain -containing protein [Bacteroidia bacterium]
MTEKENQINLLKKEIKALKSELAVLKKNANTKRKVSKTVIVPKPLKLIFDQAEKKVGNYHKSLLISPEKATIKISDQRYVLVRASALSIEFLQGIMSYYSERGEKESLSIGKNILFDLAHLIGVEDAKNFQQLMQLKNPIEMLSAGPVHFAYTGWAQVKIHPESNPSPDQNFVLHYSHPFSFEAESWIKAGKKATEPVCVMNSGYSSGWCEHSFGIKLTAVEISCRAKGDAACVFVMAPPNKIQKYLKQNTEISKQIPEVPTFLQRKIMEEKLAESLNQKELLLKEIHHRVKNNLQIISSLLNLQLHTITDPVIHSKFSESITRIKSMGILHDLLYRSKNFSSIPVSKFFPALIDSIKDSYLVKKEIQINLDVHLSKDNLNIDKAIPCGLILNEIISNALKYAFKTQKKGNINVSFTDLNKDKKYKFLLTISDNGTGFTLPENISEAATLGLQLIHSLVEQLDGDIKIESKKGTKFRILF